MSEFAEPYAARVLCLLLGLPEGEWAQVAHWADDLGKSFGINLRQDLPRIEAALEGLTGYVEAVVADRRARPRDDLVSTLVAAQHDEALSQRELVVGLVFLAFAGMETTRNQLGLALQTFLRHPDQWALLGERPASWAGRPSRRSCGSTRRSRGSPGRRSRTSTCSASRSRPAGSCRCSRTPRAPTRARWATTRRSTSPPPTDRCTAGSAAACTTASATSSPAPT